MNHKQHHPNTQRQHNAQTKKGNKRGTQTQVYITSNTDKRIRHNNSNDKHKKNRTTKKTHIQTRIYQLYITTQDVKQNGGKEIIPERKNTATLGERNNYNIRKHQQQQSQHTKHI